MSIIQQSFGTIITPLTIAGLYPPQTTTLFFKIRSYLFYTILLLLIAILATVKFVLEPNLEPVEFNDMCIFVLQTIFSTLKVLPFVLNGDRVKNCINYFGHPRFAPRNEQERRIIDDCVQVCHRNCKIYLYFVMAAAVLWFIPAIFSKEQKFPVKVWLPYDTDSSPVVFYATLVFLLTANTYDIFAMTLLDPLIGSLSYHATTRLKILKYNLQNLDDFVICQSTEKMKECIVHHVEILDFLAEFENCFSWSIFCQFAGGTLTLCFCIIGFTLLSSTTVDALKYLTFYIIVAVQEFFYCYFGALLLEENNSFMDAVCSGPWYKYDPKTRKILILMMERSKKPLTITAGKVVGLTLQTYTWILKTGYSLFAVMKNLQ